MARDIIPLDPWEDKCPWCGKPIKIEHQLAVYEGGESEQFVGLQKSDSECEKQKGKKRT